MKTAPLGSRLATPLEKAGSVTATNGCLTRRMRKTLGAVLQQSKCLLTRSMPLTRPNKLPHLLPTRPGGTLQHWSLLAPRIRNWRSCLLLTRRSARILRNVESGSSRRIGGFGQPLPSAKRAAGGNILSVLTVPNLSSPGAVSPS